MGKIKKNQFWIMIILMLAVVCITGAGLWLIGSKNTPGDSSQGAKKEIIYDRYYAFITADDTDFWKDVYEGAFSYGSENGAYVEDFGSSLFKSYSEAERIDIAVAAKVDGIIVEGADRSSIKKSLKNAHAAGIPVVLVGEDMVDSPRISFVGVGQYDLGELYGRQATVLSKKLIGEKDRIKITMLTFSKNLTEGEKLILSAIRKVVLSDEDLYGRVTIDTYPIGNEGLFSSQEMVYDFFMEQSVPDVLVALSQEHTISAYQALLDLNLVGECNIIGYNDSEAIKDAIKNEVIFSTIVTDRKQYGSYAIEALDEYIRYGYVSGYFPVDNTVMDASSGFRSGF